MADPRYRNNIFTNQRAINCERKIAKQVAFERNHPLAHGWEVSHRNKEFDQTVYTQEGLKLMAFEGDWLVEFPTYNARYQGTIKEITEDVLKELSR